MSLELPTRRIGKSEIAATTVGLGTWAIGGWKWGGTDRAQSIAAIHASIDEGISLIDTAPAYGMGLAEEIVGEAIKGRRDKVVIATKCGLVWHTQKGNHFFDVGSQPVHRYLGADSIIYEVEQSLTRLGTDYIDHYITHWQDPTTPIAETMEALTRLKEQGKIRSIGASNTSVANIKDYVGAGQLDAVQEQYSMVRRDIEGGLLPLCRELGISILSYSPLALGLLSGKMGPGRTFEGDDQRKDNPRFSLANREKITGMFEEIAPVISAHQATPAQIIIAWTLHQPGITFALCGARNPQQARENAAAARIVLSDAEATLIGEVAGRHLRDMDS